MSLTPEVRALRDAYDAAFAAVDQARADNKPAVEIEALEFLRDEAGRALMHATGGEDVGGRQVDDPYDADAPPVPTTFRLDVVTSLDNAEFVEAILMRAGNEIADALEEYGDSLKQVTLWDEFGVNDRFTDEA